MTTPDQTLDATRVTIKNANFIGGVLNEPPQPSAQVISQEIADVMRATPVPMSESAAWMIVLWRVAKEAVDGQCTISVLSVESLAKHLKSLTARLADAEQREREVVDGVANLTATLTTVTKERGELRQRVQIAEKAARAATTGESA